MKFIKLTEFSSVEVFVNTSQIRHFKDYYIQFDTHVWIRVLETKEQIMTLIKEAIDV